MIHDNRTRALRRLRQALYLNVRNPLAWDELSPAVLGTLPELAAALLPAGRLNLRRKDPRFWPAAGVVLDVLEAVRASVRDAAAALGISTANLVAFLQTDPKLWDAANRLRARYQVKPLRTG
jgi:hypothetical protein